MSIGSPSIINKGEETVPIDEAPRICILELPPTVPDDWAICSPAILPDNELSTLLSRALVITTKKGKKNSPVFVTVNSSTRFENVLKLPDFQNEYAQGSYGVYNVKMLNGWGPKISSVQDQQFTDYKGDRGESAAK